jgi:preprotein translocase subunit YajC
VALPVPPRPDTDQNRPVVTVDVLRKDAKKLDGLKPGDTVKVTLIGNVVEVARRDPEIALIPRSGTLSVEATRVMITKQRNAFSDLAEDDES